MEAASSEEREVRAARNQAMFRAVNEQMAELNAALGSMADIRTIACECADTGCVDMLEIEPGEYEAVRSAPNRFAVRPRHVFPEVERVVSENDRFAVVEKLRLAAEVAAAHDPRA